MMAAPCDRPLQTPRALLLGALAVALVNSVIALLLWIARNEPWDQQMVYSQAIGLSIWALTNLGARALARPDDPGGFPRGWRAAVLIPAATLSGALIGYLVGDAYAGNSSLALITSNPRLAWTLVLVTLAIGLTVTGYFYAYGKSRFLQSELELQQRLAAEAQLKLLQTQLEPHMLFNTLANLRALISLDTPRAQAMLDHLIAYLRATLNASRASRHTLADEFARLEDYLALMTIRMGPRLRTVLDLPADLRGAAVPPLLLQPLVENSLRHGLEPKVEGGEVRVQASAEQGPGARRLLLEVRDSGVGCDAARLTSGSGFGVQQVRERLAAAYGDQCAIETIASDAHGVCVRLRFPLQQMDGTDHA